MKKIIIALLVLASVFAFVSCSKKATTTTAAPAASAPAAPVEKDYKLGMGVVVNNSESSADTFKYDATCAVVVTDANGKIVACRIDDAQNSMKKAEVNLDATFKTKVEKQFDYNMVKYSEATKEWFEQCAAFEAYCVGKTGAEVLATEIKVRDDNHAGYRVAADPTLFASCSIQIEDMMQAVAKACDDAQAVSFKSSKDTFVLGVAINSTVDSSSTDNNINIYADFAGAVVDNGKVVVCINDAVQPKYTVDTDTFSFKATKRELQFDYNMVKYSEATKEWFEQSAAFSAYCAGKTAAEIEALPTRVRDDQHAGYVVTADDTLFASCSIQITGMKAVIAKAVNNAK